VKSDGKPHRKLKVWQAGMDFVVDLYKELENFPAREQFGLTAQLRRAAVSIPSNIRRGQQEKILKSWSNFCTLLEAL